MEWSVKTLDELSSLELYKIMQLRELVFAIEQNCIYVDCDDKDLKSWHLFGQEGDQVVAYARLLPPDVSYPNCTSIGRVVVHPDFRKNQYGQVLMKRGIDFLKQQYADYPIRISGQEYLRKFYSELGFQVESDVYLEDNIPHLEMARYF